MRYVYKAHLEADPDGGFLACFPDVPEAIAHGRDRAEALRQASAALGMALRGYLAHDSLLPRHVASQGIEVPVSIADAMKFAVIETFAKSGLSKSELARRMDKADNEAHRILDPDHQTKVGALENALAVLGKKAVLSVQDAA